MEVEVVASCDNASSWQEYPYVDYSQIAPVRHVLVTIWVAMISVTILGNVMIILVILCNRSMHTVTNFYILNLSIVDFLIATIVMPLKLIELAGHCGGSIFTGRMCPVIQYLFLVLVYTSLLTIVVISIERFVAIVYPLNNRTLQSRTKTKIFIALTWLVPMLIAIPFVNSQSAIINFKSNYGSIVRQYCQDGYDPMQRTGLIIFATVIFYLIPLSVIIFTSVQIIRALLTPIPSSGQFATNQQAYLKTEENKRKVAKMIVVIGVLYCISWTPFYVTNTVALFHSFMAKSNYLFTFLLLHSIAFINSTCNPMIYIFMSGKFRQGVRKLLRPCFPCLFHNTLSQNCSQSRQAQQLHCTKFCESLQPSQCENEKLHISVNSGVCNSNNLTPLLSADDFPLDFDLSKACD